MVRVDSGVDEPDARAGADGPITGVRCVNNVQPLLCGVLLGHFGPEERDEWDIREQRHRALEQRHRALIEPGYGVGVVLWATLERHECVLFNVYDKPVGHHPVDQAEICAVAENQENWLGADLFQNLEIVFRFDLADLARALERDDQLQPGCCGQVREQQADYH